MKTIKFISGPKTGDWCSVSYLDSNQSGWHNSADIGSQELIDFKNTISGDHNSYTSYLQSGSGYIVLFNPSGQSHLMESGQLDKFNNLISLLSGKIN